MFKNKIASFLIHNILFLIVVLLLNSGSVLSQNKYYLPTLSDDFTSIIKQPSIWDNSDWLKIIGTAALTYGTMYIDKPVREFVLENNKYKNSFPIEFGRIWGEGYTTLAISGLTYFYGTATGNNANKKIGFEVFESGLYTGLITMLFKYSFGRERPRKNSNPFSFFPFSFRDDNFLSLNSGHTAMAFSLSTVLAKNSKSNILKVVMFIPAFMTAISRIYQNHHWTSDVVLGGIIGFSVAEFITSLHNEHSKENEGIYLQTPVNLLDIRIPL